MAYLPYENLISFTPTIVGQSSAGVGIYTSQVGYYSFCGNLIFVFGSVSWTAHTGTGNMLMSNLPFTVRNASNYDPECSITTNHVIWPAGSTYVFGEFQTNQNYILLSGIRDNNTPQIIQMDPDATIHFTGFYLK